MRIRKRKVPLPLSLLSPVPLSDPHLFSQSPVHQLHPQPSDHFTPTSASDLRPLIVVGKSSNTTPPGAKDEQQQSHKSCLKFKVEGEGEEGERILHNNNDDDDDAASKEEQSYSTGPVSLSNEGGGGRWSEGERVIPLKKRRSSGSFFESKDMDTDHEEKPAVVSNSISTSNEQYNRKGSGTGGGSKQKRGTTIMEGSRCSRVNGRGWRCCQPTLVGYSLCEHHLGKGRLRSMTSVRGRPAKKQLAVVVKDYHHDQEKQQQQQQKQTNNKRVNYKLGVVKARSLSSLLGQTTTTSTTTNNNNNNDNNVDRNGTSLGSIGMSTHESDAHVAVN